MADEKANNQRRLVLEEILDTEKAYVADLEVLITGWKWSLQSLNIVPADAMVKIFQVRNPSHVGFGQYSNSFQEC